MEKIVKYQIFCVLFILSLINLSCEKDPWCPDYRDKFIGNYTCLRKSSHPVTLDPPITIVSDSDTVIINMILETNYHSTTKNITKGNAYNTIIINGDFEVELEDSSYFSNISCKSWGTFYSTDGTKIDSLRGGSQCGMVNSSSFECKKVE